MRLVRAALVAMGLVLAPSVRAEVAVETVEGTLTVPASLGDEAALATLDDVAAIFVRYEPHVPKVPGVVLDLDKVVRSPTELEIPVRGTAIGFDVAETAHVTVTTTPMVCTGPEVDGRKVVLDFEDSTR